MMQDLPGWVWVAEIATLTGFLAAAVAALYAGARDRLGARAALTVGLGSAALLGGWLLVSGYLAGAGAYRHHPEATAPAVGVALAAALAVGLLAVRIPAVAAALSGPQALARVTAIQGFRVIGGIFLVVMALGELPAVFALPAGLGDIAVGVAAPFVARRITRDPGSRPGVVSFHLLGLLDLVVAIGLGVLAAPGLLHVLDTTPSTGQLTALPLSLVPTVAVPLAVVLHLVALRQLWSAPAPVGTLAPGG